MTRTFKEYVIRENISNLINSYRSVIMAAAKKGHAERELEVGHALFGDEFVRTDGNNNWVLYDNEGKLFGIIYDGWEWVSKNEIDYEGMEREDLETIKAADGSRPSESLEQICLSMISDGADIDESWGDYAYQLRPDVIQKVYKTTYVIIVNNVPVGVSLNDYSTTIKDFIEYVDQIGSFVPDYEHYNDGGYRYYFGDESHEEVQEGHDYNYQEFLKNHPNEGAIWIFLEKHYPQLIPSRKIDFTKIRQ